jgi:hypothetical protein
MKRLSETIKESLLVEASGTVKVVNDGTGNPIGIEIKTPSQHFAISIKDEGPLVWKDAKDMGIPTKDQWESMIPLLPKVNKLLDEVGGDLMDKRKIYWSSDECLEQSNYRKGYDPLKKGATLAWFLWPVGEKVDVLDKNTRIEIRRLVEI